MWWESFVKPVMQILWRYVLAYMGCFGIMNVYFCRINLSVAIVAMIGVTRKNTTTSTHCVGPSNTSDSIYKEDSRRDLFGSNTSYLEKDKASLISDINALQEDEQFDWTIREQGLVMGSYYWGYVPFQVPMAWMAKKYGFRRVFGYCMLVSSLLTMVFPFAAKTSVYMAIVSRILLGVFHAISFPAMAGAWGAWAPPLEKTQLYGLSVSGASIGTLLIFTLAGYLADLLGWEAVFYATGGSSLVWACLWFQLVWDTPAQHPYIGKKEQSYIQKEVEAVGVADRTTIVTPWRSILTSIQVWGILLGHTASNWGNYTLNQQLPTYLTNVLRYSLSFQGLLASLCYLVQWIVCVAGSWATDQVRAKGWVTTITVRKLNTFIGLWVTGACAVLAVYAGCQAELAVTLFAISTGLNSLTYPGCKASMLDIAPAHAGIVFGVSNTVSNIPGFVAPAIVGFLLTDYSDLSQWYTIFWISALVHVTGSLVFLLKGSDQVQDWAKPRSNPEEELDKPTS